MVTRAAVLCGGEGTRLRPLTHYFQKTMVPVGSKKAPLLQYIIKLLAYNGLRDITLLTGYRSEDIERYFEDGSRLGVRLTYSRDPEHARGSAVSLHHAASSGALGAFDELVLYYGDVLSALDVREVLTRHREQKSALTLVVSRDYRLPVGVAEVKGGDVVSFREKPTLPLNVTMGCLVISSTTLPVLERVCSAGGSMDVMTHFVPAVIAAGMKVSPFYLDGFWYDVGTTEAYEKLDSELVEANLKYLE